MIKGAWLEAIDQIEYRDWQYKILGDYDHEYLQIQFFEDGEIQKCRKWPLTNSMTASEIVKTAWMATLAAEEHEARERFRYKGKKIFNPHLDVDVLVAVVGKKENLDLISIGV